MVNATGCNFGGGKTWVYAVLREIKRNGPRGVHWRFVLQPNVAAEVTALGLHEGVALERVRVSSPVKRLIWEQCVLWLRVQRRNDVLLSAANFGPVLPCRQVLLARNPLHFDSFRMHGRKGLRHRIEVPLARAATRSASVVVTATQAMADRVISLTGVRPRVQPFGPGLVEERRGTGDDRVVFLHRTGWGPHKSFGDLLRAIEVLGERHPGKFVVKSACDPRSAFAHRFTESGQDRELLKLPRVNEHLILREFPPNHDAHLEGDAVLMTSALESFSFPLAEAVALGIPVIAANTMLSRELTGGAAYLYEPNSYEGLAEGMERVIEGSPPPTPVSEVRARLSWSGHVEGLVTACREAARQ